MTKVIASILLVLLILSSIAFIILRLAANGSENNFFNRNWRTKFAEVSAFRELLYLHNDGDAKSDYLGSNYSQILIEVDEMAGISVPETSLDLLTQRIAAITGKKVSYLISDTNIPFADSTTIVQAEDLTQQYRNVLPTSNTTTIYVLALNKLSDQPDEIGSTLNEYGMALFLQPLKSISTGDETTFDNYVESTALHEFGHLLGLQHNNMLGCLMTTYADQSPTGFQNPDAIITDFCDYEKTLIQNEKNSL